MYNYKLTKEEEKTRKNYYLLILIVLNENYSKIPTWTYTKYQKTKIMLVHNQNSQNTSSLLLQFAFVLEKWVRVTKNWKAV